MTRISDLNRNQDLTDGDVFPIGAADGSTRGITASDSAKYFTEKTKEDIAPLIDEATQAADDATQAAINAESSADSASASAATFDQVYCAVESKTAGKFTEIAV